jgi:nitrous oxide reductase accessory protein NosL
MKKLLVVLIAFMGLMGVVQAKGLKMPTNYRAVPFAKAQILQQGEGKMFCVKCGMTLPMFYRTNHAAKIDGKTEQFCSMYCLIEEMNSGKKVTDVQVVDNTTLKFIPASKAFYVVGSSKPATMAKKVSKYAFGTEQAAKDFAAKFGGEVMRYDAALALAKKISRVIRLPKKCVRSKRPKQGR